jgi:hypothetical protein
MAFNWDASMVHTRSGAGLIRYGLLMGLIDGGEFAIANNARSHGVHGLRNFRDAIAGCTRNRFCLADIQTKQSARSVRNQAEDESLSLRSSTRKALPFTSLYLLI